MKTLIEPGRSDWAQLIQRPQFDYSELQETVRQVFEEVAKNGDEALRNYSQTFDGVRPEHLLVSKEEIEEAEKALDAELIEAIGQAFQNISAFHRAQIQSKTEVETQKGVYCWQEQRPIEKVGLYIPGGSAPLFSTLLMLAIPAKIAGCKEIVLCTPPSKNSVHPAILYTAKLCGVDTICTLGGIQAIAAMTYGTESVPAVYKLFGPGNQYVTAAKQYATQLQVAIDMPAGPSEVLVVADASAPASFIAADLLSQAEHGPDSQVILVAQKPDMLPAVEEALEQQLADLPRADIAREALGNSLAVVFEDKETANDFINTYAPEHYIVISQDEEFFVDNVRNAGSVFVGPYSPESAGDYASGTNHTLPTNGYARQYSGVNLQSFTKAISFQKLTKEGILGLGPAVEKMALAEGLQGHQQAVRVRLNTLEQKG